MLKALRGDVGGKEKKKKKEKKERKPVESPGFDFPDAGASRNAWGQGKFVGLRGESSTRTFYERRVVVVSPVCVTAGPTSKHVQCNLQAGGKAVSSAGAALCLSAAACGGNRPGQEAQRDGPPHRAAAALRAARVLGPRTAPQRQTRPQ